MGVKVGIIMGSQSDWPTMKEAAAVLDELGVAYETGSGPTGKRPRGGGFTSSSPAPAVRRTFPA